MSDFHFKRPGRLAVGFALVVGALTIAACGGGSNSNSSGAVTPVDNSPLPVILADRFVNAVKALLLKTSDSTEPGDVSDVAVTAPENTEPDPTP